jgi:hypothetical protein
MSQDRFFTLLDRVPRITHLWDRDERELNMALFDRSLDVMSPSECHLARFFVAVWFGDSRRYGFDFVDAVSRLDANGRQILMDWLSDPFWP